MLDIGRGGEGMKAIPMRSRLSGRKIAGFLWAGPCKD